MAIVTLSERKIHDLNKQNSNVGPGSYLNAESYRIQRNFAPFISTASRMDNLKTNIFAPGPGSYNISKTMTEKTPDAVLLSTTDHELKMLEISQNTYQFKSNIKRFEAERNKNTNPGPGTYDCPQNLSKNFRKARSAEQNRNKLQKIFFRDKKNNINLNIGYGPNEFAPSMTDIITDDTLGPGQYDFKDTLINTKKKGIGWSKLTSERFIDEEKPTKKIGPGAYEIDKIDKFNKKQRLKPSSAFASKTDRLGDLKKGDKSNNFIKSRLARKLKDFDIEANEDSLNEEFEFIEDSVPGPGYYHIDRKGVEIERYAFGNFGGNSVRFDNANQIFTGNKVGPGTYDQPVTTEKIRRGSQSPFMSRNKRFKEKFEPLPGPGAYEGEADNIVSKLIKKFDIGYKGYFGSKDKRFKAQKINVLPGPGDYSLIDNERYTILKPGKGQPDDKSFFFKSETKRDMFDTAKVVKNNAEIGHYDVTLYDISKGLEKEHDMMDYRPAFGIAEKRFKELNKEDETRDNTVLNTSKTISDVLVKKKNKDTSFLAKDKRFRQDISFETPGPGKYKDFDRDGVGWNKRTYNILYEV